MIYSISPESLEVIEPIRPPSRPRKEFPFRRWLMPAGVVSVMLHMFALCLASGVLIVEAEPDLTSLETLEPSIDKTADCWVYLVPDVMPEPTVSEELLKSIGYYKPARPLIVRGYSGVRARIGGTE